MEFIVDTLCNNMIGDNEQLRDISSIGLKTVINELPLTTQTLAATGKVEHEYTRDFGKKCCLNFTILNFSLQENCWKIIIRYFSTRGRFGSVRGFGYFGRSSIAFWRSSHSISSKSFGSFESSTQVAKVGSSQKEHYCFGPPCYELRSNSVPEIDQYAFG